MSRIGIIVKENEMIVGSLAVKKYGFWSLTLGVFVGVASWNSLAYGQSGTKIQPRKMTQGSGTAPVVQGSTRVQGSSTHGAQSRVAIGGYCPVCIINMRKWVKGSVSHQVTYDGKTYLFPDEAQKNTFLGNPGKYVPAAGGDCTVCLADSGKRMAGSTSHTAIYKERLFLFPDKSYVEKFLANPSKYGDADLAMGGHCVVCKVEMNQDVPGNPAITEIHQGMRYRFAAEEQQKMFTKTPAKYAQPIGKPFAPKGGSGSGGR